MGKPKKEEKPVPSREPSTESEAVKDEKKKPRFTSIFRSPSHGRVNFQLYIL